MGRAAADLPGNELRVEGFVLRVDLQRRVDLFATRVDQRDATANGYSTRRRVTSWKGTYSMKGGAAGS